MEPPAPTIAIELLSYVADWLDARGVAVAPLLRMDDVDPAWLQDFRRYIPLASYANIFERAAETSGIPHLGMRIGRFDDVGSLGALGHLFMSAPSLLDGFEAFTSHLHALQEGTVNRLSLSGDRVLIEYRIMDNRIVQRRQDAEYSIAANESLVRLYTLGAVRPREVYFEHGCVGSYSNYRAHFGCDVFFEQPFNALVYDREGFNVRSAARTGALAQIIAAHLSTVVERRAAPSGVAAQVEQMIASGVVSECEIARQLAISIATLGRRLRAERASFRDMLGAHRIGMARRMLVGSDQSIAEIALAVGYAENASFSRAFRRRVGVAPHEFRQLARLHGPALASAG